MLERVCIILKKKANNKIAVSLYLFPKRGGWL
jgi:hypothetical protein